jgi:hypothetical protein
MHGEVHGSAGNLKPARWHLLFFLRSTSASFAVGPLMRSWPIFWRSCFSFYIDTEEMTEEEISTTHALLARRPLTGKEAQVTRRVLLASNDPYAARIEEHAPNP